MNIGDKRAAYLEVVMTAKGFNSRSLSLAVGSNPTLVRDIITRQTKNPTSKTWDKLAQELKVELSELLDTKPKGGQIIPEILSILEQLDPATQVQLAPQLKGLLEAQQAKAE